MRGFLLPIKKKDNTQQAGSDLDNLFNNPAPDMNLNPPQNVQQNFPQNFPPLQQNPIQFQPQQQANFPAQTQQINQPIYNPQPIQEQKQNIDWESYIQALAEKIVDEKIKDFDNKIGELRVFKEKIEIKIEKIEERVKEMEERINNLYDSMAKKLQEYDKGMEEATTEIQALHRLIRTMIPAISESTRELKDTIEEIKRLREKLVKE